MSPLQTQHWSEFELSLEEYHRGLKQRCSVEWFNTGISCYESTRAHRSSYCALLSSSSLANSSTNCVTPVGIKISRMLLTHLVHEHKIMNEQVQSPMQFLTLEESADVDKALLSASEKFLTRLTISSSRLLKIISQDLDMAIEDLTHQQIIDWFEKDGKVRREQGIDAAVLKW